MDSQAVQELTPSRAAVRARVREVVTTMMLAGLDAPLARFRLSHCATLRCRVHCTWRRWTGRQAPSTTRPAAVRDALIGLGPAFVKIGQILSVRADLVPEDLAAALRSLQSNVPAVSFEEARRVIAEELEEPIDDFFTAIDEVPLAAGSIAQVHLGTRADGRRVALKVKRPGIDRVMRLDLEVLQWLARTAEKRSAVARSYRPLAAAEELRRYTLRELDFRQEAGVARRLRVHHAPDERVRIPEIYYASDGLIVMEYIESFPADDRSAYGRLGIDPHDLLHVGIEVVIAEIFDLGLFHADPHPGNLHVTKDGELVLLDFGIFGELEDRTRRRCALAMWALVRGDVELASLHLVQIARVRPHSDTLGFRNAMEDKYRAWRKSNALDYGLGRLIFDSMSLAARHGLDLPSDAILVGKALTTVEGLILWVDPEIDLNAELQPYLTSVARRLFDPRILVEEVVRALPIWWDILERLPSGVAQTLERSLAIKPGPPTPSTSGTPNRRTLVVLVGVALLGFGAASLNPWAAVATGAAVLLIVRFGAGEDG